MLLRLALRLVDAPGPESFLGRLFLLVIVFSDGGAPLTVFLPLFEAADVALASC